MITSSDYINENGNLVPENKIVIFSDSPKNAYKEVILDLRGNPKRDWFTAHFYYCLPLTIGNQQGFAIKSLYDFKATWEGGLDQNCLSFKIENPNTEPQYIMSLFGSGIITIQNNFMFRTEPGVSLMTIQPPNYFIPGLVAMTGVIETDNLRRDFSFNLKITEPNKEISIKKGDILAAFIPIKRHFVDKFEFVEAEEIFSEETLIKEMNDRHELVRQRLNEDKEKPHESGRKYFNGIHAHGELYCDHQKRIII
jgi:hypothetical protein